MDTLKELNDYCILKAKNTIIKNGKLNGFNRDHNTKNKIRFSNNLNKKGEKMETKTILNEISLNLYGVDFKNLNHKDLKDLSKKFNISI